MVAHGCNLQNTWLQADVVGCRIMSDQQWSLAPLHGVLACARPGFLLAGPLGRPGFPSWLGRNSTGTKRMRLLRELGGHMQVHASGDKAEIRQAYVPALRHTLLAPLLARGSDGIADVIALLDEYNLSKVPLPASLGSAGCNHARSGGCHRMASRTSPRCHCLHP